MIHHIMIICGSDRKAPERKRGYNKMKYEFLEKARENLKAKELIVFIEKELKK